MAPASTGLIVNLLVPDTPVVDVGLPPHYWIAPTMSPQIERIATWISCESSSLDRLLVKDFWCWSDGIADRFLSRHLVPVALEPDTTWLAGSAEATETSVARMKDWNCVFGGDLTVCSSQELQIV